MLVRAGITGCARAMVQTSTQSINGKSMLKLLPGVFVIMCMCDAYNCIGTANRASSRNLLGPSHSNHQPVNQHANVPSPTTPT